MGMYKKTKTERWFAEYAHWFSIAGAMGSVIMLVVVLGTGINLAWALMPFAIGVAMWCLSLMIANEPMCGRWDDEF